jgi:hypothetical protein
MKPRDLRVFRVLRHVDQAIVSAGGIETGGHQPPNAQLAHIAEGHRRAGGLLGRPWCREPSATRLVPSKPVGAISRARPVGDANGTTVAALNVGVISAQERLC